MIIHLFFIFLSVAIAVLIFTLSERRGNKRRKRFKGEIKKGSPLDIDRVGRYTYMLYEWELSDFRRLLHFYILKWIRDDVIEAELVKDSYVFRLNSESEMSAIESELFSFFKSSEFERRIYKRDFEIDSERNRAAIAGWDRKIKEKSRLYLISTDYLVPKRHKAKHTDSGEEILEELRGFQEYMRRLDEYKGELKERDQDIDELIMFSALLGAFDTVESVVFNEFPYYYDSGRLNGKSLELAMLYSKIMSEAVYPPENDMGLRALMGQKTYRR